jgi:calcineurin-like phosphoesterase family protein
MNRVLTERWNSVVKPDDTVYHLGDFSMGSRDDWKSHFDKLNGNIHLVYGNHDAQDSNKKADSSQWTLYPEILSMGFRSISEQLFIQVDGYKLWLAHIPLSVAPDKRKYQRPAPTEDYDIALCGHVHDKFLVNDYGNINVGCDNFEFYPQSLSQLLESAAVAPIFDSSQFLVV